MRVIACVCLLALGLCSVRPAAAGPNVGGWLFVVTDDAVSYTSEVLSYAQRSGVECPEDREPGCPPYQGGDCPERKALVQQMVSSRKLDDSVVFWLLAAFPEGQCSGVRGLTFGIDYDVNEVDVSQVGLEGDFALTSAGASGAWPAPGSGAAVIWNEARSSHLFEVAWFVVDVGRAPTSFRIVDHPLSGAPAFADNSVPAQVDVVGSPGYGPPVLPVLGLCGAQGTQGGYWIGEDPPIVACCLRDGTCRPLTQLGCNDQGGAVFGVQCDPVSCVTPIAPTSWGRLKQRYR